MAPSRRKGASKAATAAAARRQWKVGDLVLAKLKGFPAWPATVSEPEKWGFTADWKKVLVYFFGTQQIAFCNPADVEAFTEEKKQTLLVKRHGKGADFVRAVQEIIDIYEKSKKQGQFDDFNSGAEVTAANFGNSVESSPNVQLKEISEAPAETSITQAKSSSIKVKSDCNENSLPGKEATTVSMQAEGLHVKPEDKEVVLDERAKDQPVLCTYSLRKKSKGSQIDSSITRKRVPSIRRSRSSSGVEASRLENFAVSGKDIEKVVVIKSSNSAQDASSHKSRWTRKTPDISKGDDKDSPPFVQNGSIEDSDSEIVSIQSESTSFNDGNAADSSLKQERETVIDWDEGQVELRKGLDLQIDAVLKKKRRPNRKRVSREAAEPNSNADNGAVADTANSAGQDSAKTVESCPKDDGDEHLPLLKRARVRMGKLLPEEDENTSITCSEEKVLKEVLGNSSDLIHNSYCEEIFLKEVELDASKHNNNSISHAEEEILKKVTVHASLNSLSLNNDPASPCMNKETSEGVSISEDQAEYSDQRTSLLNLNKNQSYVSSVDGEAALPPSKRLHRAFEAMYANAAQDYPSSVVQPTTSSCFSSQSSPPAAIACESGNDLRQHIQESVSNLVSHDRITLSPVHLNQKSFTKTITVEEMDICQHSVERPESPVQVEKTVSDEDVKKECTSIFEDPAADSLMETQSMRPLSPMDDPFYTKDEANAAIPKFGNASCGEENAANRSACFVPEVEKITAVSSGCGLEALQRSSEYNCVNGGNKHRRLKFEDSSQDNTVCHANETRHDWVLRNGNCVSCSNPCLEKNGFPTSSLDVTTHSSPRISHLNATMIHTRNSDEDRSKSYKQDDESCSPVEASHFSNSARDTADSYRKLEPSVTPPTSKGKSSNYSEAHAVLSSFEAVLGTLTRMKESISRATRIALDCAKLGFASKAIEVLTRILENESSLYRRVDMFFLVDSIMQCSRGLKGNAGGVYPSLIQGALPRLLSAAAPPGSSAHENRRQCLKVLKLWQERRFLPDSILRYHIRELDVFNGPSSANPYSRRSSRNERAFDDPVREMEGMLVDEYGSNSSFQLPGFCLPRMLKNGSEGSDSDSDGSFEAVTPEHYTTESPQQEISSTMEKHRHILQDVDGELEMEDVAPEVEMFSTEKSRTVEQQFPPPTHAVPQVLQPSPQPISPLPPLPPAHPSHPVTSTTSDCHVNGLHKDSHANAQNIQGNLGQPPPHRPVPPRTDQSMLGRSHYHNPEDREPRQQMPISAPSNTAYSRRSMENGDHEDGSRFNNGSRGYHTRPPHSPPSNHFSYSHSDQRGRPRRDGPPPYSSRFHHQHNKGNGNYHYNNHDRMKPPPYEDRENWRFSAPYSGPRYPEKGKSSYASGPYGGPSFEPERFPNHGWSSHPPRLVGHRNHMPDRPHYEGPGYWRPR